MNRTQAFIFIHERDFIVLGKVCGKRHDDLTEIDPVSTVRTMDCGWEIAGHEWGRVE